MKTPIKTKIALISLGLEKPEMVETFEGSEDELRARLLKLQEGYCEDETPELREIPVEGGTVLEAVSDCDYSYAALLK